MALAVPRPNRRRFPRVRIPAEAFVRCYGDGFRGLVRVLGEGGMYVDTNHPQEVDGPEMEVVIESAHLIHTRCIARDHEPGTGMGVEFMELPETDRARLLELIAKYSQGTGAN